MTTREQPEVSTFYHLPGLSQWHAWHTKQGEHVWHVPLKQLAINGLVRVQHNLTSNKYVSYFTKSNDSINCHSLMHDIHITWDRNAKQQSKPAKAGFSTNRKKVELVEHTVSFHRSLVERYWALVEDSVHRGKHTNTFSGFHTASRSVKTAELRII